LMAWNCFLSAISRLPCLCKPYATNVGPLASGQTWLVASG
jgi:hypothetical protein